MIHLIISAISLCSSGTRPKSHREWRVDARSFDGRASCGNGHADAVCSAGRDCVTRLLDKSERRRLGSKSGASEVKQHKWFSKINWGLLRNMRPPIVPSLGHAQEAGNFRSMKESHSLHLEEQFAGEAVGGDLFGGFSSVTLHYDGDS